MLNYIRSKHFVGKGPWPKNESQRGCFDGSYIKVIGLRLRNIFIAHHGRRFRLHRSNHC